MKIALGQSNIKWEDKPFNLSKLLTMTEQASKQKAELILFPEMSLTGFSMNTKAMQEFDCETVKQVEEIAREHQIAIGFGWIKGSDEKAENHYTVIDASASIISDYTKIHPFSYANEDKYFRGGETISFFTCANIRFCTFICYDLRFPELFRIAGAQASIIVVAANWPAAREEHWRCLLRARAIENQCYMIGVNCVGWQGKVYYSGNSVIVNPNGEILYRSNENEELIICDIDNDVDEYRNRFPVMRDRKPELYTKLSSFTVI